MTWDEVKEVYHYPCPCGDRFEITRVGFYVCSIGQLCFVKLIAVMLSYACAFTKNFTISRVQPQLAEGYDVST